MDKRSFQQHLDPSFGPKRILALDGGGLRGVVTLAFLKKIESILADQSGRGNAFRLSDYYDLIGGTSTGAIIAAGLSLGMSVEEIRAHYYRLGESVFKSSIFHFGILNQKYDATKVASALQEVFSSRTLGSEDYKTGLAVMSKRLDTGSQWVLGNNPRARYFNGGTSSDTTPNSSYPLWAVVRASTAAPTYFDPEFIQITPPDAQQGLPAVVGEFVDGGVSTLNNPALQLVLMATAQGYGFNWKMGEHDLSVTSVGTGRASKELGLTSIIGAAAAPHAIKSLKSVLEDCADLVEMMMQWLSQSPTARSIDREIGALEGCYPSERPSLRYYRYNVHFEPAWFKEHLDMDVSKEILNKLAEMDVPSNMKRLEEFGHEAARRFVLPSHFAHP